MEQRKIGYVPLIDIIFAVFFALFEASNIFYKQLDLLRYTQYLLPLFVISTWIIYPNRRSIARSANVRNVIVILFAISIPYIIDFANNTLPTTPYYAIFFMAFLPFMFPIGYSESTTKFLFFIFSACQVLIFVFVGGSLRGFDSESLASGSAAATNTLPYAFGMFFVYFFANKKWKLAAASFGMILIAGKRSVLFSSLGSMFIYVIYIWFFRTKSNRLQPVLAAITIVGLTIYGVFQMQIAEYVCGLLDLNVNVVTSGRHDMQQVTSDMLKNFGIGDLIFGKGMGTVDYYALVGSQGLTDRIHNDYFRLIVDFGFFSGILYVTAVSGLLMRVKYGFSILTYTAFIWLTENSMIYMSHWLLVFTLLNTQNTAVNRLHVAGLPRIIGGRRASVLPAVHPTMATPLARQPGDSNGDASFVGREAL